jgi:putative acetyltransferase
MTRKKKPATAGQPVIGLSTPESALELADVAGIFQEYAAGLGVDLCFQNFDAELATLPGDYASPRGVLLLANASEMKRLYVRTAFRGLGLGRQLAKAVMDRARLVGYSCVLLDTLSDMEAARALYEDIGFEEVPPYYHNPIPGAHYLKAQL